MKSILLLFTAVAMSLSATAQKPYSISKDEQTGQTIFKGPITISDLTGEPSFTWYKRSTEGYTPDASAVAQLSKTLPQYNIIAIMGTWCDDSQNIIPKLEKVLQATSYPMHRFSMWGVDRDKQTGGVESKLYDIKRVPTIILLKDGKEVGRIVESVSHTVEGDLVTIVEKGGK